ncbi:MAG: pyruvate dehydrogenase (acetyl-transferring), homodimeric type, partial [Leucobacter sp.]
VMYYLTVYNEPIIHPAEPENVDVEGITRGIHRVSEGSGEGPRAQILASGVAVPWAIEAQELLASDWGVTADVWSVTSWTELQRDGLAAEAHNFRHFDAEPKVPYLTEKLQGADGPFVAVSDWASQVPELIRAFVPGDYSVLGADGFGFSDTRAAARRYFGIDRESVVVRVLQRLAQQGKIDASIPVRAAEQYRLDDVNAGTTGGAGGES